MLILAGGDCLIIISKFNCEKTLVKIEKKMKEHESTLQIHAVKKLLLWVLELPRQCTNQSE